MDGEFEAENLDTFFDWDDDQFIPTFLQSDTSITALQDLNLMENFNFQTEVPPVNPSAVMESIDQAETQVQLTDPTSWFSQGPSSTMAFGFVPNPLPSPPTTSVLNGTQLINSLPSLEELMFDGEGPSFPGLDVTQTACSNQLPDFQDQNVLALEDLHFNGEQNTFDINNFNVNQSSSVNPALVHPNPVQVSPANETYSSGLFAPSQRPEFFPVQNHISDSLAAWNSSRPQQFEFSSSDIYGAHIAPNCMQPFSTVQNQVGHSSELRHIHDLQSQSSMGPVNSLLEPYSDVDTAFVTMPAIPYQLGCRPLLPKPAVPSASSLANYGQKPSLFATSNSQRSGSSGPPTNPMYSPFQDQRHHPQVTMPNIQGQQSRASMQQWSPGAPNHINKHNQRMNTPNLRRRSSTSPWVTGASSSRVSTSREAKIAPGLRIQEEATIPKNEVRTSPDKGNLQGTSSTRSEPSEAIRRILNMNPSRLVRRPIAAEQIQGSHLSERARYEPPSRGRPPKRRFEEYFQRERVSSEIGNAGTTPTSRQALHIPYSYRNAIAPNPPSAPRFSKSLYDIEYERKGHPIDPLLRLFKRSPDN
ncbi:uncharacterized protein LOC108331261 [Vigna angularis]|uniref:uncharacterized protein LOC108331261 n=1 Tax=Phaseolus angularis TaxID=3914 RepID=UPI00080A4849|nr:uncharacterized protein LOC108331261 [Vigna angularis]